LLGMRRVEQLMEAGQVDDAARKAAA
jgi:hypothetical protein